MKVELGSLRFPYKSMKGAMSEILNLRSNRSNDNVTIFVKEETDNLLEKGYF